VTASGSIVEECRYLWCCYF